MDHYRLDAGASVLITHTYNANSVYDPDASVGGGSPSTATQWAYFYRKYQVLGCKIRAQFNNEDAAHTIVGIIPRNTDEAIVGSATAAQQRLFEGKNCVHGWLPADGVQTRQTTLSMYRSTRKVCGRQSKDQDYCALTNADPAKMWYYDLVAFNEDITSAGATVHVDVTITYYVRYFEAVTPITV